MNPDFLGLPVLITAGIGLPLIIVFAAVRIYARAVVLKRWKLDDCELLALPSKLQVR